MNRPTKRRIIRRRPSQHGCAAYAYDCGARESDGRPLDADSRGHIAHATGWNRATVARYMAGWTSAVGGAK